MRNVIVFLFIFCLAVPCFAVTVGGPSDMETPEASLFLKNQAVRNALDMYEYNLNWKGSAEVEVVLDRKLKSVDPDTSNAEMEGRGAIFKLSTSYYNVIEPYFKIGSSQYKIKWKQHDNDVTIDTEPGIVWGAGIKTKLWEFADQGVKLTLDLQYRNTDLSVEAAELNGSGDIAAADNKKFEIQEWQWALLASKKLILPLGQNDVYMIPYAGATYSIIDVDAQFIQSDTGGHIYSTYNTSDRNPYGLVLGFDMMPSLTSWYLWTVELRLVNETAFTIGGTARF